MKPKWKIVIGILVLALIAGAVTASVKWGQKDLVTVQTGLASKSDLTSIVTASGEIKPRNYINIGANAQGRIAQLMVKEGDHVRKGQVVARIEHIQAQADVAASRAAVSSAMADSAAQEAGVKAQDDVIATAAATVDKSKSELAKTKMLLDRAEQLQQHQLIAKQDYDTRVADYRSAQAALREDEARLAQVKSQRAQVLAQLSSYQRRVAQSEAGLERMADVLAKFDAVSPIELARIRRSVHTLGLGCRRAGREGRAENGRFRQGGSRASGRLRRRDSAGSRQDGPDHPGARSLRGVVGQARDDRPASRIARPGPC